MNATGAQTFGRVSHNGLKWLGALASVCMVVLFGWMVSNVLNQQDIWRYMTDHWRAALIALMVYGLAWIPISAAWIVVARQSKISTAVPDLLAILYLSQAAKYLPGNVGQYIGRVYLATQSGVPVKNTTLAMALEIAAILVACALLTTGLFALSFNLSVALTGHTLLDLAIKYAGLAVAVVAILLLALIVAGNRRAVLDHYKSFLMAVILMMATVGCFALANMVIVGDLVGDLSAWVLVNIFSAVVISWFAGFITPGAPAGLGIREVVFFALLSGTVAESSLLLATLVFRLVTIVGDLGAFFVGLGLRTQRR